MSAAQSLLKTALTPDQPLVMASDWRFNSDDRRYIDNQILALQEHVSTNLINGVLGTWFTVDGGSAALAIGDVICSAGSPLLTQTKATTTPLAAARAITGVVLKAASPGGKVLVASGGFIPAAVSGLSTGAAVPVRVSSAARLERVASPGPADVLAGVCDINGNVVLVGSAGVADALDKATAGEPSAYEVFLSSVNSARRVKESTGSAVDWKYTCVSDDAFALDVHAIARRQTWTTTAHVSLVAKRFFLSRINGAANAVEFDTAIDVGSSTNALGLGLGVEISGANVYATTDDGGDDIYWKVSVKRLSLPGGP